MKNEPILSALEFHRAIKEKCKLWNKKHYSGINFGPSYKYKHDRKKPWYMMTTGKQYNFEERKEPWGQCINYYRVPSQAAKAYNKTIVRKLTHEEYNERLIQAKLNDWIRKNPCPVDVKSQQKDLFEQEYLTKWNEAKEKMLENITHIVNNLHNRVNVYARYRGDNGYSRRIMEFKSDGRNLMILDGAYVNHMWSNSIKRAQKRANDLGKTNPNFVSLMVVDGEQKCILIPHKPLSLAA